jgi:DNA-binding transcriptional ArsR family regulator
MVYSINSDGPDGAQVRLAALAMTLGEIKEYLDTAPAGADDGDRTRMLVSAAHQNARETLAELRDLARVLTASGGHGPREQAGLDKTASASILRYVPKYSGLDQIFHALADSTRRAMVERLSRGPASVSELARPFPVALPTVVQHQGVLETAGIVTSAKAGRVRTYQLVPGALDPAGDWVGRQRLPAERRLDRLGTFLNRPATTKE